MQDLILMIFYNLFILLLVLGSKYPIVLLQMRKVNLIFAKTIVLLILKILY